MNRRLGGPQSRSGRRGEEKNIAPVGNRTPAVQPVAIPIELSQLPLSKVANIQTYFNMIYAALKRQLIFAKPSRFHSKL
jgi:hypothetical protein